MTTQEERLLDFARRQKRASARPVKHRGRDIDPRCRLPTLARLLEIDAAAEQAAGQLEVQAAPTLGDTALAAKLTVHVKAGEQQATGTGGPTGSLDRPRHAASGSPLA